MELPTITPASPNESQHTRVSINVQFGQRLLKCPIMTSFETSVYDEVGRSAHAFIDLFDRAQKGAMPSVEAITHPRLRRNEAARALRVHVAQELLQPRQDGIDGWIASADPARMTHLELKNPALGVTLRILKERSAFDNKPQVISPKAIQPATYNPGLWGAEEEHRELALLFDVTNPLATDFWHTPLRVVRTVGGIRYGTQTPLNLTIPVIDDPGFYTHGTFKTANGDEDLYANIHRDENETRQA